MPTPYLPADLGCLQVLYNYEVGGCCLEPSVRDTPLKQVTRVSDSSKQVLPKRYLSLAGTVADCLQELWELLDELHDTRKEGIWEGRDGEREERREGREREGWTVYTLTFDPYGWTYLARA
jgi:hypothetical protein